MGAQAEHIVEKLIDRALAGQPPQERAVLIKELFALLEPEAQAKLLQSLLTSAGPSAAIPAANLQVIQIQASDQSLRRSAPMAMCYQMMLEIDKAEAPETVDTDRSVRLFSALGEPTRIRIIKLLSDGECAVDQIATELDLPQPTASHHLKILKEAQLLRSDKRGRSVFYSLRQPVGLALA